MCTPEEERVCAQFFLGNPERVGERVWIGCLRSGGFPRRCRFLSEARNRGNFVNLVRGLEGFDPAEAAYPFDWKDDVFKTDYTYTYVEGEVRSVEGGNEFQPSKVMVAKGHRGWFELATYSDGLSYDRARLEEGAGELPKIPAPNDKDLQRIRDSKELFLEIFGVEPTNQQS